MEPFKITVREGKTLVIDETDQLIVTVQEDRETSVHGYGYFIAGTLLAESSTAAPQQFVFELLDDDGDPIDDGGDVEMLYEAVEFYFRTQFPTRQYVLSVPQFSFVYEEPPADGLSDEPK